MGKCVKTSYGCPRGRDAIIQPNRCVGCEFNQDDSMGVYLRGELFDIRKEIAEIKDLLKKEGSDGKDNR